MPMNETPWNAMARLRTVYDLDHCPRCEKGRLRLGGDFGDEGLYCDPYDNVTRIEWRYLDA